MTALDHPAGIAIASLTGPTVDRLSMLLALTGIASVAVVLLRRSPKTALCLWLLVVCFVPVWFSVNIAFFNIPPASLVGLMVLAVIVPSLPQRVVVADAAVLFLVSLAVVATMVGFGSLTTAFVAVAHWGLGYTLGRLLPGRLRPEWIYSCVAVVLGAAGLMAVVEFFSSWNPFVGLARANNEYAVWGFLQDRGGITRAEGAFGHSIALGASLALAVPLALGSSFRSWIRFVLVACLLAGTVVSFSRIGVICAVLGILLSLAFLPRGLSPIFRWTVFVSLLAAGAAVQAAVASVFIEAGTEASGSADYRLDITSLLSDITWVGLSPSVQRDAAGSLYFGSFRSIDSALLLLGLTYGALALAVVVGLLVAAIFTMLRQRATPPTIAVVAQVPGLLTVALITQYATFFWFIAGLAVAGQAVLGEGRPSLDDKGRGEPRLDSASAASGNEPAVLSGKGI